MCAQKKKTETKNNVGTTIFASTQQAKTDAFEAASGNYNADDDSESFDKLLAKFSVSPWLLDPRSKRMKQWDGVIALALVYTATVTPYEVAFIDTKPGGKLDASLRSFPIYVINV